MKLKPILAAGAAALAVGAVASSAHASHLFVGSWEVDQGPSWTIVPPAYTGQEAAALLFGGSPGDYTISTVSANPHLVDGLTWVSTWGGACGGNFPCGTKVADNSVVNTGGLYASPGDQSSYVQDWAVGSQFTNYAFIAGVPEPATWAMMLIGVGALGATMRRRTAKAVAA